MDLNWQTVCNFYKARYKIEPGNAVHYFCWYLGSLFPILKQKAIHEDAIPIKFNTIYGINLSTLKFLIIALSKWNVLKVRCNFM